MKSLIRSLNERGITRFRSWLEAGASGDAPFDLLDDPQTSEPVTGTGEVEQTHFANRYDLAAHVLAAFQNCDFQRASDDAGIWGWLSLFYIDLLCPKDLTNTRKVLALHRYLFDPSFRTEAGHLIREAVIAVRAHGEFSKVLLVSPTGGIKDTLTLTQIGSRRDLITNPSIVELAWRLYFDSRRKGLRHGAASRTRPGAVRRFAQVTQQLSLTYDLPGMTTLQIAELLPEEFSQWKQRAKLPH
jgi:hypothetical protein